MNYLLLKGLIRHEVDSEMLTLFTKPDVFINSVVDGHMFVLPHSKHIVHFLYPIEYVCSVCLY